MSRRRHTLPRDPKLLRRRASQDAATGRYGVRRGSRSQQRRRAAEQSMALAR